MRKMFMFLMVLGVLAAPTMAVEAAVDSQDTAIVSEVAEEKENKEQARLEERLLREAKRVVREIFKAQRNAKKVERAETNVKIAELRKQVETAERGSKKELREEIKELRENKKYDSVDEFLDNLVLYYGAEGPMLSEGYVVYVADTRKNLDANVTYDKTLRTLVLTKDDTVIRVTVDAESAYVDGEVLFASGKKEASVE